MRKKLAIQAEIDLMEIKKEAETLEAEIRVMESDTLLDNDVDSELSSVRRQRTSEYVQKHSSSNSSEILDTKIINDTQLQSEFPTQGNPSQVHDQSTTSTTTVNFQTTPLPQSCVRFQLPTELPHLNSISQQQSTTQVNLPAHEQHSTSSPQQWPTTQANLSTHVQTSVSQQPHVPAQIPHGFSQLPQPP